MSLKLIERQIMAQHAREAEKAKATGVAESLAAALQIEIDKAVQAALQRAQPPRLIPSPSPEISRRLEAVERRLQATTTMPEVHRIQIERDGTGLARAINIGSQRLLVQRGVDGSIAAMVPVGHPPTTYNGKPVPPASINRVK